MTAAVRQRRLQYRVKPPLGGKRYGWRLLTPAGGVWTFETKRGAVSTGRTKARQLHEDGGRLTQLVVHGRNGRFQYEHTYGRDPERRPG